MSFFDKIINYYRGFTYNGLLSSAIAYTQSSKDCLSPYFGETHKDLFLLRSFAYGFGMLLTGSKLNEIFNQYNQELSVKLLRFHQANHDFFIK